jgi:hypothetical protein
MSVGYEAVADPVGGIATAVGRGGCEAMEGSPGLMKVSSAVATLAVSARQTW